MKFNIPRARRVPFTTSGATSLGPNDYGWQWTECFARQRVLMMNQNLENFQIDLPYSGEGVDLVVLDNNVVADHPDFTNRLQQIDWFQAAGGEWLQYQGTQNWATYYQRADGGHGTPTASVAAGALYGFAKSANIFTITHNFAAWDSWRAREKRAAVIRLITDWHKNKPSRNPTVLVFGSIIGSNLFLSSVRSVHTSKGTYTRDELLALPLSERINITLEHRIDGMTSNRVGLQYEADIKAAMDYATSNGVHLVYPGDNKISVLQNAQDDDFSAYWFREWSTGFFLNITCGSVPVSNDTIVVGAVGGETDVSVPTNSKSTVREFIATWGTNDGSPRGARVDIFAPGTYCPAARDVVSVTTPSGTGMFRYPGSSNRWASGFSGTSCATPITAGALCCLLSKYPAMSPASAKSALLGAASVGRIYEYDEPEAAKRLSLMGAPNRYLYYPV